MMMLGAQYSQRMADASAPIAETSTIEPVWNSSIIASPSIIVCPTCPPTVLHDVWRWFPAFLGWNGFGYLLVDVAAYGLYGLGYMADVAYSGLYILPLGAIFLLAVCGQAAGTAAKTAACRSITRSGRLTSCYWLLVLTICPVSAMDATGGPASASAAVAVAAGAVALGVGATVVDVIGAMRPPRATTAPAAPDEAASAPSSPTSPAPSSPSSPTLGSRPEPSSGQATGGARIDPASAAATTHGLTNLSTRHLNRLLESRKYAPQPRPKAAHMRACGGPASPRAAQCVCCEVVVKLRIDPARRTLFRLLVRSLGTSGNKTIKIKRLESALKAPGGKPLEPAELEPLPHMMPGPKAKKRRIDGGGAVEMQAHGGEVGAAEATSGTTPPPQNPAQGTVEERLKGHSNAGISAILQGRGCATNPLPAPLRTPRSGTFTNACSGDHEIACATNAGYSLHDIVPRSAPRMKCRMP